MLINVYTKVDCFAINIVGGINYLLLYLRGNYYILIIIDCFTRILNTVFIVNQFFKFYMH